MHKMTEWMEAAKVCSVKRNKMKESDKSWTEWNKQNLCCEYLDDAVDLYENALSHDFGGIFAISDILSTSGNGITVVCMNFEAAGKEDTNVDGRENCDTPLLKFCNEEGKAAHGGHEHKRQSQRGDKDDRHRKEAAPQQAPVDRRDGCEQQNRCAW